MFVEAVVVAGAGLPARERRAAPAVVRVPRAVEEVAELRRQFQAELYETLLHPTVLRRLKKLLSAKQHKVAVEAWRVALEAALPPAKEAGAKTQINFVTGVPRPASESRG